MPNRGARKIFSTEFNGDPPRLRCTTIRYQMSSSSEGRSWVYYWAKECKASLPSGGVVREEVGSTIGPREEMLASRVEGW